MGEGMWGVGVVRRDVVPGGFCGEVQGSWTGSCDDDGAREGFLCSQCRWEVVLRQSPLLVFFEISVFSDWEM